jgi:hypothetical protein
MLYVWQQSKLTFIITDWQDMTEIHKKYTMCTKIQVPADEIFLFYWIFSYTSPQSYFSRDWEKLQLLHYHIKWQVVSGCNNGLIFWRCPFETYEWIFYLSVYPSKCFINSDLRMWLHPSCFLQTGHIPWQVFPLNRFILQILIFHHPMPLLSSYVHVSVCIHLSHIFFNSLYVTNDLFSLVLTSILCRSISTHLFIYSCPHIAIILSSFFPDYPTYLVRLIPVLFHSASCLLHLYSAVYCSS